MPKVDVVDLQNKKVGEVELADEVFAAPVNEHLLYESVRHYQASQRGGNAKTKTRHEVSGSGMILVPTIHGMTTHISHPANARMVYPIKAVMEEKIPPTQNQSTA